MVAFIIMGMGKIMDNIPAIALTIWGRIAWVFKVLSPVVCGFVIAYLFQPIAR